MSVNNQKTQQTTQQAESVSRYRLDSLSRLISLRSFLCDKIFHLAAALSLWVVLLLFLLALRVRAEIIVIISVFWWLLTVLVLAYEYLRRRRFYRPLVVNLSQLQQAYLILEALESPHFYDGKILYETLLRTDKSMAENVQAYALQSEEFREYVEMWIHEVKTPLATLSLLAKDPKVHQQIKRLDDYVEQILYFVRAENAERDYLVKAVDLERLVGTVASRNREILLASHIDFSVSGLNQTVYTDAKWLEFILNQILMNSIKYGSTEIHISAQDTPKEVVLTIHDNGIGIAEKDLPRVFDKSFTGSNGRKSQQSTGMGLYIAKTLCEKLGHQISVDSKAGQYTDVKITFAKNNYYKNVI